MNYMKYCQKKFQGEEIRALKTERSINCQKKLKHGGANNGNLSGNRSPPKTKVQRMKESYNGSLAGSNL